jgi:hypothetical protein
MLTVLLLADPPIHPGTIGPVVMIRQCAGLTVIITLAPNNATN